MLAPGLAAAAICAAGVALWERRALAAPLRAATQPSSPLSRDEWHAVVSLAFAAVVASVAPLAGIAPWWPFAGAVAVALAARRERPQLIVPWRVTMQVGGLLVATSALGLTVHAPSVVSLPALLAVAAALGVHHSSQQPAGQRLRDRPADSRRAGICRLGRARDRLACDAPGVGRNPDRIAARGSLRAARPGPQARAGRWRLPDCWRRRCCCARRCDRASVEHTDL